MSCGCAITAAESTTGCVCPAAGFCERHGIKKPEHFWKLCKTRRDYFQAYEEGRGPGQGPLPPQGPQPVGLGDAVAWVLSRVGVTPERVSEWLGKDCGCDGRKKTLNRWKVWGWWRAT